jgi:hypothetical protein
MRAAFLFLLFFSKFVFSNVITFTATGQIPFKNENSCGGSPYTAPASYSIIGDTLTMRCYQTNGTPTVVILPSNSCVVKVESDISTQGSNSAGFVSNFCRNSSSCSISFPQGCNTPPGYSLVNVCSFRVYLGDGCSIPLPPCSTPVPMADSRCNGGQGLWGIELAKFRDMFGAFEAVEINNHTKHFFFASGAAGIGKGEHVSIYEDDNMFRPDKTECRVDMERYYDVLVCPLGFAEFDESSSSSTDDFSSSSISDVDLCADFPNLPGCNNADSSSGSGGYDGDGDCADLSNCDWAKVDIQLLELGVAVDTRNLIKGVADLAQADYNLTLEQNALLNGVISSVNGVSGAVGGGVRDIVGAIDDLAGALGEFGGGGSGIAGGVADGLGQFFSDTTGLGGSMESMEGAGQAGADEMYDNIDWLSADQVSQKLRSKIDSSKFSDFERYSRQISDSVSMYIAPILDWKSSFSPTTRLDLSFDSGFMGIGCTSQRCSIDLTDIFGLNLVSFINGLLVLASALAGLVMIFRSLKTGGHD